MNIPALISRYANGFDLIRSALAEVPPEALKLRPAPGKWSVHEIICHCADSETNSAMRIKYLVGEDNAVIQGYDQDRWASAFDYHAWPLEPSLRQIESVRSWTTDFITRLPADAWQRAGTHSEMPGKVYTAALWLEIYAEHLEVHARQIHRNLDAWKAAKA